MIVSKVNNHQHTNEEGSSLHYPVHHNLHDTLQQCDLRKLSVHIEQQHELPAPKSYEYMLSEFYSILKFFS